MDQFQKGALLRTRVELVNDLDVSAELCDELMSQDIFSPIMIEYIMGEHTRMDKVRRLLDDLARRGSNAYHGFLVALKKSGYDFLASKIAENEKIIRREIEEEKEKEKRKKCKERECPMQMNNHTAPWSQPPGGGNDVDGHGSCRSFEHCSQQSGEMELTASNPRERKVDDTFDLNLSTTANQMGMDVDL